MRLFICILPLIHACCFAQSNCRFEKRVFPGNEVLKYEIFYHWGLIWANAGEATFSVSTAQLAKNTVMKFSGSGSTYKSYDWFYKVRDRFETWVDSNTLKPLRYIRNTNEGSTRVYNDNYFDYASGKAYCYHIKKDKVKKDSVKLKDCAFDVLSMIYYSRCIDYSKYAVNAKIPITLYLDGQIYDTLYIRYLGIEKIKTEMGELSCVKFRPLLISGTIFTGGEGMTVWATNDEKKIPVLITTPIVVGEIQVKIKTENAAGKK